MLTNSNWGSDQKILLKSYLTLIFFRINYGSIICNSTKSRNLQIIETVFIIRIILVQLLETVFIIRIILVQLLVFFLKPKRCYFNREKNICMQKICNKNVLYVLINLLSSTYLIIDLIVDSKTYIIKNPLSHFHFILELINFLV